MESSPWEFIDKNFGAERFVGVLMNFPLENCGTSLPDDPVHEQIFTLVDSLTVPTYLWTFRYNKVSITHKWEFIGGLGTTIFAIDSNEALGVFTSTGFKNVFDEIVYYKSGCTISLPYAGEYEFTGGVIVDSAQDDIRVSTQIVYRYKDKVKLGVAWPLVLKKGFNHVPLPLKRLSGLNPGKVALGISSIAPLDTIIRWSTCVVRPIKIQ